MLFTKEWAKVLKKRLEDYLDKMLPSLSEPLLYKMLEVYQKHNAHNEEVKINEHLKQKYMQLEKEHQALLAQKEIKEKQQLEAQSKWLQFTKGTIGMAKKLLTTMSSLQGHQVVSNRFLLSSKEAINNYESQLTKEEEAYNDLIRKDISPHKKSTKRALKVSSELIPNDLLQAVGIDYKKIKNYLVEAKDELKLCAVLQALAWKITNKGHIEKVNTISEYVKNDLLDLNHSVEHLKKLLNHSNKKVVKYTLILLNELATKEPGGNYIASQEEAIVLLIGILRLQVIC